MQDRHEKKRKGNKAEPLYYPLFQWYLQSNEILLNLRIEYLTREGEGTS
jgi:hypothetical protein